jgi:hypothetical protein
MIDDLLRVVSRKMSNVEHTGRSAHIPSSFVEIIETNFLGIHAYTRKIPALYPSGFGEEQGYRSLKCAANATYNAINVRVGLSELHIADKESEKNMQAIMLLCTEEAKESKKNDMSTLTCTQVGIVTLLEDGTINALHMPIPSLPIAGVVAWGGGDSRPGCFPYEQDRATIKQQLDGLL